MSPLWPISAGELFELTRPASFVLSALASAWVLASARRQEFAFYAVAAWTLSVLFYPLIFLPIYLIVRSARRRTSSAIKATEQEEENASSSTEMSAQPTIEQATQSTPSTQQARPRLRFVLPPLYLLIVLTLGALFYYQDAQSIDAHLARANRARLLGQREKTIREYRAALKLEENAHTRNLLGIELMTAGQMEEALAEFRAAERAGEADDQLPYRIANTLDALQRTTEAVPEYQKFLSTRRCKADYPDPQCAAARVRVGQ